MAQGGFAMASHRGKPVFVPYALPGESISAEVSEDRGSVIFASGKSLHAASADRVTPRLCPFRARALLGLSIPAYRLSSSAIAQAGCTR